MRYYVRIFEVAPAFALAVASASGFCSSPIGGDTPADATIDRTVLPLRPPHFSGSIELNAVDSIPDEQSRLVQAPEGAPNILLIMTDDVGFGASSTFGGPIPTPTFEHLAENGLRYNRFHTAGICSATRAALLTGRNHHNVGNGAVAEIATGFPGYDGIIPKSAATLAEVLRLNGFSTAMFGKEHNTPPSERSSSGPFDHWPTGMGFEYFYGFIQADTNQWAPALYRNTTPIEPDYAHPRHLDALLADEAINWLRDHDRQAPGKPFFIYYAPGSTHAPHHAPAEWVARFRGKFDDGWDAAREASFARQKALGVVPQDAVLTPRPSSIPAWSSLSIDEKRLYARMMEVYAASLAFSDNQIGRLIDAIAAEGKLDNTIIVFIQGDNGASAEGSLQGTASELKAGINGFEESLPYLLSMIDELGGPMAYNHYPVGWAWAMNAPFPWAKQIASHLGGTRNGMVVSWLKGISARGELRDQFSYITDIMPTILDAAGLPTPLEVNGFRQKKLDGVSLGYTFQNSAAPGQHETQYFEMMGNRALYQDGWLASTTPRRLPWMLTGSSKDPAHDFAWELYDLRKDFSQSHDLAQVMPAKLAQMKESWLAEAKANDVLPLDDRALDRPRLYKPALTSKFVFYGRETRTPFMAAPPVDGRSFRIVADLNVRSEASGVIATYGGRFGGWTFFMRKGVPVFEYALSNQIDDHSVIQATQPVTPGVKRLVVDFRMAAPARGSAAAVRISDGKSVIAEGIVPKTARIGLTYDESFDVGADTGTPASENYTGAMPFAFDGEIIKLVVTTPE